MKQTKKTRSDLVTSEIVTEYKLHKVVYDLQELVVSTKGIHI